MVSADFFNVEMRLVLLIVYYMFYSLLVNQEWVNYREMSEINTSRPKSEISLLYGLFIMDLSLWSIKTNNWSADNLKKTRHLNELYT